MVRGSLKQKSEDRMKDKKGRESGNQILRKQATRISGLDMNVFIRVSSWFRGFDPI
jgi:hypothetical protein